MIDLNRKALRELRTEQGLEIIPGATHLFEEPGALEKVAELAARFFIRQLGAVRADQVPASGPAHWG